MRWYLVFAMGLVLTNLLFAQRNEGPYRLKPEDVIRIQVFGVQGLDQEFPISKDGTISVSLIGVMQAAGLTTDELARKIEEEYRKKDILRDPRVSVSLRQFYRPRVSVLGFVGRPGVYEFKEGDRVLDALSLGGNPQPDRARLEGAWLQRADGTKIELDLRRLTEEGDLSLNVPLQDGDVIFVPEETENRFFVGGQVKRPGLYTWRPGMTVLDALGQASWETERARMSQTYVIRKKPDGTEERMRVDMVRLLRKGDMSQNIGLQPGDVVYVAETNSPDPDRVYRYLSVVWILRQLGVGRSLWKP
ncbi:MAG: polysaccharide biosynthesis/export family protein [Fimbriimonadales bacterium]